MLPNLALFIMHEIQIDVAVSPEPDKGNKGYDGFKRGSLDRVVIKEIQVRHIYSVMQSDRNSFSGDVFLDSVNMAFGDDN